MARGVQVVVIHPAGHEEGIGAEGFQRGDDLAARLVFLVMQSVDPGELVAVEGGLAGRLPAEDKQFNTVRVFERTERRRRVAGKARK